MARPKRAVVGWEVERGAVQRGRLREVPSLRHTAGGDAAIACWLGWVGQHRTIRRRRRGGDNELQGRGLHCRGVARELLKRHTQRLHTVARGLGAVA